MADVIVLVLLMHTFDLAVKICEHVGGCVVFWDVFQLSHSWCNISIWSSCIYI